jgi:hypothetical protein
VSNAPTPPAAPAHIPCEQNEATSRRAPATIAVLHRGAPGAAARIAATASEARTFGYSDVETTYEPRTGTYVVTGHSPEHPSQCALHLAAVTVAGLAAIVAPPTALDPAVAYQLSVIDQCRPEIARLAADLNRRGPRMNDASGSLAWQLEREQQALHIAEERLLDLYGMPRRAR